VQIRDTTRFQSRLAGGVTVDRSDKDDGEQMAGTRQLTPQLYSGEVLQVNVQHKAGGFAQMRTLEEVVNIAENLSIESMDLQHALHRSEDAWIIVYNDDEIARAR